MHFSQFLCKAYSKVDFGHAKIFDAIFFWVNPYYLVLATVLNDIYVTESSETLSHQIYSIHY